MEYQFLTEAEQHDVLVAFLTAQERDHYCHTINRARYVAILQDTAVTPAFRARITDLLNQTDQRLHEVSHLIEKTRAQLPAPELVEASKARVIAAAAVPPKG